MKNNAIKWISSREPIYWSELMSYQYTAPLYNPALTRLLSERTLIKDIAVWKFNIIENILNEYKMNWNILDYTRSLLNLKPMTYGKQSK